MIPSFGRSDQMLQPCSYASFWNTRTWRMAITAGGILASQVGLFLFHDVIFALVLGLCVAGGLAIIRSGIAGHKARLR
jgi:hypothetical protein